MRTLRSRVARSVGPLVLLVLQACTDPADLIPVDCQDTNVTVMPGGSTQLKKSCGDSDGTFVRPDSITLIDAPQGLAVSDITLDAPGDVKVISLTATTKVAALFNQKISYMFSGARRSGGLGNLFVTTVSPLQVSIARPTAIVDNQSWTLDATATGGAPPYAFSWSPPSTLDQPSSAGTVARPDVTTAYQVTVTDSAQPQGQLVVAQVTIDVRPAIGAVQPAAGSLGGGRQVTIQGFGFQQGATVAFGGQPAAAQDVTPRAIVVTTPSARAAGAVDVTVTNPDGRSATLPGGFTYFAPAPRPVISAIDPRSGPYFGGTHVTITGSGFRTGAAVSFGGAPATVMGATTDSSVTVSSPARDPGAFSTVDVTVTNTDGQVATLAGAFTYVLPGPAPVVAAVVPSSGSALGGAFVRIEGSGFVAGSTVSFGNRAGSIVSATDTAMVVLTPPAPPGTVDVTVTNPDRQSATLAGGYTYTTGLPPLRILGVTPNIGLTGGGNPVVITGSGFQPGASVQFGSNPAAVTVNTATSLSVIAPAASVTPPAGPAGLVNITVTNPDGQFAIRLNSYTYAAALHTLKVENQNLNSLGLLSSDPSGIANCGGTCTATFAEGTRVDLFPESFVSANWSGCDGLDVNHVHCFVIMNTDKTVTVK